MNTTKLFAYIGIVMTICETIIGVILYFSQNKIFFLFAAIGIMVLGLSVFLIIIKTNYEPFQELSCGAIIYTVFFFVLALCYFPWDLSSSYFLTGLYSSSVSFSWVIYLTSWNIYAITQEKKNRETKNGI